MIDLVRDLKNKTSKTVAHLAINCPYHNRINALADILHGDIAQNQREVTLKRFKENKFQVLVATDVAARGLDIPSVDLVV